MAIRPNGVAFFAYKEGKRLGHLFNADESIYDGQKNGHGYVFYQAKRRHAKYIHGLLFENSRKLLEFLDIGDHQI